MQTGFWELFVKHVTTNPRQDVPEELNRLATAAAAQLGHLDAQAAAGMLSAFAQQIAEQYSELHKEASPAGQTSDDPSAIGAPAGAPKPSPVPPEVLAEAKQTLVEEEIAEAIREIRRGGGRKFEDFIRELDSLPSEPNESGNP